MNKEDLVKLCNQIFEMWREGYTDREIRESLKLEPIDFTKCLQLIKKDNLLATEAMMLFEKEVIRLHDIYKKLMDFAATCEDRHKVNAWKSAADISKSKIEIAQKLNAIDPQRFVLEVHNEQKKKYREMTLEELVSDNFAQLEKFNPH